MNIEELANLNGINEVEETKVNLIANSIIKDGWNGPAILYHSELCYAITGSHRIAAAKKLVDLDEENEWETEYADIEVEAIAVDGVINAYCEKNDITIDQIAFDNLSELFAGSEFEQDAKQNVEW